MVCLLLCVFLSGGCKRESNTGTGSERYMPPLTTSGVDSTRLYAVVEIPAGSVLQQAIDSNRQIRPISDIPVDFLPFPGNYGFIAGCATRDTLTGKTFPLPVCIMMPALREGSRIAIIPVAVLLLRHHDRPYPVIVAIPEDIGLRSIHVRNFVDFMTEYDAARYILQTWFLNYLGRETFEFVGWRDEHYASSIIRQWKIEK